MALEFSLEEALGKGTQATTEFSLDEALGRAPVNRESTIGSELVRGGKQLASSMRTGFGALGSSPEEAAKAGIKRGEAIAEEAGEGASLDAVKRAYQEDGLLSAAGEVLSQVPRAVASQGAQLALMAGGAKAGALAGSAIAPGAGTVIGGVLGAGATLLPQLFGSNVERQASEQMARYEDVNINRVTAGGAAVAQSGLEAAGTVFVLGKRLVKGVLGITDDAALATAKAKKEMVEAANRSLLYASGRGTVRGAAVEMPIEVASSVIERAQAGLDVTSPDAIKEYGEVAYQSALVGGALGTAGGAADTAIARQKVPKQTTEAVTEFEKEKDEFRKNFGATEPVAVPQEAVAEPPTEFPGGYTATRREVSREDVPESFGIFAEGSDKPLTTVIRQEEADAKLQSLSQIRQEEQARLLAESEKITKSIFDEQRKLEVMEATGQTESDQYIQAKALLEQRKDETAQQIADINDKILSYSAPLKSAPIGVRTDIRNEFNVNRGTVPVGTFSTLEEVEASLRERDPEPFKQAEVAARKKALDSTLRPLIAKFNLGDVGLNVVDQLERNAGGRYLDRLIEISLQEANPIQTMRHESMHALKNLGFFTPQQWKALTERANSQWIKEYMEGQSAEIEVDGKMKKMSRLDAYKQMGLTQEEIVEEAIADAFGAYDKGATPPPGMIAALFKKLKDFFMNFGQALRGAGFESSEDIFQRVERGELKSRKPKEEKAIKEPDVKLSVKNTIKGLLNPSIEPKYEKIINGVAEEMGLTPEEFASTSLVFQTGKAGTEQFETAKIGGLPEVVQFLQDQRRISGLPLLNADKPEDRKMIAKLMATEAMAAIRTGAANLEWYDSIINKTLAMAGLKYQELNTDINARMAFRISTAITSQGLNVEDNLAFAMKVYDQFRKNGKFPEVGQGADQGAMINNFKLANYLMDDLKPNMMRQFLETEFTVEELRSAGFNIAGELGDEKVLGSSVFGPKIGFGFYSNLNGNFDPVTMDMWFMRTIGRLTGKLKSFRQDLYDAQLDKFRAALDAEGSNGVFANQFNQDEVEFAKVDDKAAEALSRKVKSAHERDYKVNRAGFDDGTREKSKLVAVSETMIKSLDAPKDAPANGSERRNLRDVVRQMVDIVEEKYGKRVPPASLQAVIWYPEQELYKAMGVKLRVTSQSYAGAMEKILKGEGYGESDLSAASKLGSRTAQQLAKSAVAKRPQAAGAEPVRLGPLQTGEKEALLERGRKRVVLAEEKETPKRKRVIFEVAPDPNNKQLTAKWKSLTNKERIDISDKIGNNIIKTALNKFGVKGYVDTQVGSYLDDTNPSFALYLESGDSVEIANFLGYALSQDSMMVVSPKPAKGLDKTGSVRIKVGDLDAEDVDEIYQKLREIKVDGEKPVGGQSYTNGHMVVLNYSNVPTKQLAALIENKLGKDFEIIIEDVYTAFPEKKDYNYDNPSSDPRGNAGVLRQASRDTRSEAARLLQKELAAPKPEAAAETPKLSLRTAPTTPEFKRFFSGSKVVNEDGSPKVMYHGTNKDFNEFIIAEKANRTGMPDGFYFTSNKDDASRYAKGDGASVMPVYLSIKNPFNLGKKNKISKEMVMQFRDELRADNPTLPFDWIQEKVNIFKEKSAAGSFPFPNIGFPTAAMQRVFEVGGYDGLIDGRFDWIQDKVFVAFDSKQVKSATGNIGTYDPTNPDIRYSLKNVAFPSVKEVEAAVSKTSVPKTEEFKRFIAGNQWVDEGGDAKVFYHATAREFVEFEPGPIYLSEEPEDAKKYGVKAQDRLQREAYRALTKEEKLDFFERVLDDSSISEEQSASFMNRAKRKIPDYEKFGDLEDQMHAALLDLSPTKMTIMPLYARAETPFDFENKEHVQQVMQWVANNTEYPSDNPERWLSGLSGRIKQGVRQAIEDPRVQKGIRRFGFDSFTIRDDRTSTKSYAVYDSTQLKSVTGNLGEYVRETKDIRYSLRKVRYSDSRFDKLWNQSMYAQNNAENKTKGYLAFVNPLEFVYATSSPDTLERLRKEQEPLDVERLKAYDLVPFLEVSEKNGNWKITGHEGRHRMLALYEDGYREVPVYIYLRADDAKSLGTKSIAAENTDAMSSFLIAAEVEPLSYANKKKALDKFTRMKSKAKFSIPVIPANLQNRIDESVSKRVDKGFARRMIEAISPSSAASFRQASINRYNQMSVYDKKRAEQMGGAALLADQSAESAALMSDLSAGIAASAMGYGDRNGGIPVLRNGITTIDTSVKGMIASLAPLAASGDPAVYQRYQYWAMVKRGQRLNSQGRLGGVDSADVAFAKFLEQKHPEFVSVQKDLTAFNNGLVKYMVDTGVLSQARGAEYVRYADYIPFYRQMDGENTLGPNLFASLSGVKPPKKLKGAKAEDAPLADFLENMVRNTQSSIQAGMKNYAAQRALDVVTKVQAPGMGATRLNAVSTAPNTFNVLEKGVLVSYETPDNLLIEAVKSLNLSELPFMSLVSGPADLLRNLVTRDPGFMMANLLRDSLSAFVTSGVKMTPVVDTVMSFGKSLARKSTGFEALLNAGIIGGYEFSGNIERSGRFLSEDLDKKSGNRKDAVILRPFKSLWDALETGTTASDAATRAVIYDRVLAETGNEAEALYRALEVMNFHRKGNSALIRVLTAAVPFFNARLQGLDLFYRASTGNMNNKDAAAIQRQFIVRGFSMMALSTVYYFMVSEDEEYKNQEQETKDNNWLIPSLGIRIPIPFEVGVLFKTIPERLAAYLFGDDTGKDLRESLLRNAISTFAFNPIPQTVKPIIEASFDFSTFTWRPILSEGLKDVEDKFQVGPGTSTFATKIAQGLGLSPVKVDFILKGYTGTIGMYGIDAIDMVLEQFGDSPKATKRFEQLPVIKRFTLDADARGSVTQYYQLKDAVDTVVRTLNFLEKNGESDAYVEYLTKNQGTFAFKDYIRDTERVMKQYREMKSAIRISTMSGDEKRDTLLEISRAENAVTSQIQVIKKAIASVQ